MLHDAVLERVVGDVADPATGVCPSNGSAKALIEGVELVVHLDAQGLEGLACGMTTVTTGRGGYRSLNHVDKLEGRLDGRLPARLHDGAGDACRVLLVAIHAKDSGVRSASL